MLKQFLGYTHPNISFIVIISWVLVIIFPFYTIAQSTNDTENDRPNIIIIYTDEHNLRTLGCYREQLGYGQSNIWGEGNNVNTPNIDSLAREGALFSNFYAVVPVCSPSRASFLTGLYPSGNGVEKNHMPMKKNVLTFADILRREGGYHSSYIGKWHLDGEAKPGWEKPKRDFGFRERKYQWNRGHWKYFNETYGPNGGVQEYTIHEEENLSEQEIEESYATDFLFTRAIKFMKRQRWRLKKKNKKRRPYLLFLSIPDPHGPNVVRPPYDRMFDDMTFEVPPTASNAFDKSPATPIWAEDFSPKRLNAKKLQSESRQRTIRNIYGMVKNIDDNIGRLRKELRRNPDIHRKTILIFTSDHGDLVGEHGRDNKGLPYLTSAGVPFIMSYPGRIQPGKVIKSAYSTIDFAPTILKLANFDLEEIRSNTGINFHGVDGSEDILDDNLEESRHLSLGQEKNSTDGVDDLAIDTAQLISEMNLPTNTSNIDTDRITTTQILNYSTDRILPAKESKDRVRYMMEAKQGKWASAYNSRFKLIVSDRDVPWLFDRDNDPDEVINVYGQSDYTDIQQELLDGLLDEMRKFDFTLLEKNKNALFWDRPVCLDSRDQFYGLMKNTLCAQIAKNPDLKYQCNEASVQELCPVTCGICCKDSDGMILIGDDLFTCKDISINYPKKCFAPEVKEYCPETCGNCENTDVTMSRMKVYKPGAGGAR